MEQMGEGGGFSAPFSCVMHYDLLLIVVPGKMPGKIKNIPIRKRMGNVDTAN